MRLLKIAIVIGGLLAASPVQAATILIDQLPPGFTTALGTPGRQIVSGEPAIMFNIPTDVFAIDGTVFGISSVQFANALIGGLPTTGVNIVVVQDAGLGAGAAATAIAARVTAPGAGFFVYFNAGLQLPRLVYSADLNDPDADLAILARMTNLSGPGGFAAMPTFTADNFAVAQAPEPAGTLLLGLGVALSRLASRRRRA